MLPERAPVPAVDRSRFSPNDEADMTPELPSARAVSTPGEPTPPSDPVWYGQTDAEEWAHAAALAREHRDEDRATVQISTRTLARIADEIDRTRAATPEESETPSEGQVDRNSIEWKVLHEPMWQAMYAHCRQYLHDEYARLDDMRRAASPPVPEDIGTLIDTCSRIGIGGLGYDAARAALDARIGALVQERDAWKDISDGRENLLACYRTGNHRRADAALARIAAGHERLRAARAMLLSTPPTDPAEDAPC